MKDQRHKRKEIYSVLMVSNTNGKSKQFQVSAFTLRFCAVLLALLCIVIGWLIYQVSKADGSLQVLRQELAAQKEQVQQLEADKDALTKDKLTLAAENEALKQQPEAPAQAEEKTEEEETDSSLPNHYPYDDVRVQKASFSEEQPYISILTYTDGHVVAAGAGTVTAVWADDPYAHIIEIEHEGGYKTRYLLHQDAEVNVEQDAQVEAGDILLTITSDDCQLDYQVLLNDEPIDPLSIIDAKG